MARRQTFSGDSIEGILVEIRENYGNEAKIVSATRMKHRGGFGLGSRYTFEVTIEKLDPPAAPVETTVVASDRLDVRTSDPRDFATFATELQRAWLDAKSTDSAMSVEGSNSLDKAGAANFIGFVDEDTEDTLVISADARRTLRSATNSSSERYRTMPSMAMASMSSDSDPFVVDYPEPILPSTPMVVSSQGRWRIPAKVSLPTWRAISSKSRHQFQDPAESDPELIEDPNDPFVRDWEDVNKGAHAEALGGPTPAVLGTSATVVPANEVEKVEEWSESPRDPDGREGVVIDLRTAPTNLAERVNGPVIQPIAPRLGRSSVILELLGQLHQAPMLSPGGVVIYSSSSSDGLVNFEALCDVYRIEDGRRFIGAGRGIPSWLSTPPSRVASALEEGTVKQSSFAIWLAHREIGQLVSVLGRRDSLVFTHIEDPGECDMKQILELPRIDGICVSSILSPESVERSLSLKLPILTLEGQASSVDKWVRLVDSYLEVQD